MDLKDSNRINKSKLEKNKKISEALKGKILSLESRQRMSIAHRGANNSQYGKYLFTE
jgi:hypothetical protein